METDGYMRSIYGLRVETIFVAFVPLLTGACFPRLPFGPWVSDVEAVYDSRDDTVTVSAYVTPDDVGPEEIYLVQAEFLDVPLGVTNGHGEDLYARHPLDLTQRSEIYADYNAGRYSGTFTLDDIALPPDENGLKVYAFAYGNQRGRSEEYTFTVDR
jgi:hypothetical protein